MAERTDEGKLARRRAVRPAVLMSAMMLRSIAKTGGGEFDDILLLPIVFLLLLCCWIDIDAHLSFAIGVVLN
jgi:hypothetical protein